MRFKRFYLTEKALNIDKVKSLKKDFLTLMKNVKIIKDYETGIKWSKYVENWRQSFDTYTDDLVVELKNRQFKNEISKDEFKYWDDKIRRDLWKFNIDFRVPLNIPSEYSTKENEWNKYIINVKKWESRVRRSSRMVWKTLTDFIDWWKIKDKEEFFVPEEQKEQINIKGYSVTLMYSEKTELKERKLIYTQIKNSLTYLNNIISKIKFIKKLPIMINITHKSGLDVGGEYHTGKKIIEIHGTSISNNVKDTTRTILHELCHHTWRMIGGKLQSFWENFIRGNWGDLDLEKVYNKYNDTKKPRDKYAYVFDNEIIKKENPILYLQLQGLYDMPTIKNIFVNILTMEDLKKYLDDGGSKIIKVHKKPITGYAHKNAQEAFCEAVSTYLVYGDKYVDSEIKQIIKIILEL